MKSYFLLTSSILVNLPLEKAVPLPSGISPLVSELNSTRRIKAYQTGLLRPPNETIDEHYEIINAIEKRNALQAEKLMKSHIMKLLGRFEAGS